ncbi:MAG TPA: hypothetical protein VIV14_11825 [Gammaproteobacteria bacterium]
MNKKLLTTLCSVLVLAACSNNDRPPNRPPTIGTIADQSITANQQSAPIGFTVADEAPSALGFQVVSDNSAVVPDGAIVVGGAVTNRSLTITPTTDVLGDAFVTVIATDFAGLSASSTFLLTVAPEQQALQAFTRATFAAPANGEPVPINAIEFNDDAANDDFADLLAN